MNTLIKPVSGTSSVDHKNENSPGCCSWLSIPPRRNGFSGLLCSFESGYEIF